MAGKGSKGKGNRDKSQLQTRALPRETKTLTEHGRAGTNSLSSLQLLRDKTTEQREAKQDTTQLPAGLIQKHKNILALRKGRYKQWNGGRDN